MYILCCGNIRPVEKQMAEFKAAVRECLVTMGEKVKECALLSPMRGEKATGKITCSGPLLW